MPARSPALQAIAHELDVCAAVAGQRRGGDEEHQQRQAKTNAHHGQQETETFVTESCAQLG